MSLVLQWPVLHRAAAAQMKFLALKVSCENILKCLFLLILFLIYIKVFLYLFKDKLIQEKDKFLHKRTNTGDMD